MCDRGCALEHLTFAVAGSVRAGWVGEGFDAVVAGGYVEIEVDRHDARCLGGISDDRVIERCVDVAVGGEPVGVDVDPQAAVGVEAVAEDRWVDPGVRLDCVASVEGDDVGIGRCVATDGHAGRLYRDAVAGHAKIHRAGRVGTNRVAGHHRVECIDAHTQIRVDEDVVDDRVATAEQSNGRKPADVQRVVAVRPNQVVLDDGVGAAHLNSIRVATDHVPGARSTDPQVRRRPGLNTVAETNEVDRSGGVGAEQVAKHLRAISVDDEDTRVVLTGDEVSIGGIEAADDGVVGVDGHAVGGWGRGESVGFHAEVVPHDRRPIAVNLHTKAASRLESADGKAPDLHVVGLDPEAVVASRGCRAVDEQHLCPVQALRCGIGVGDEGGLRRTIDDHRDGQGRVASRRREGPHATNLAGVSERDVERDRRRP